MQSCPSALHLLQIGLDPSHLYIRPLHVTQPSLANPSKRRFLAGGVDMSEPQETCEGGICSLERNDGRENKAGRRPAEYSAGRSSRESASVDDDGFVEGLLTGRGSVGASRVAEGGGVSGNV